MNYRSTVLLDTVSIASAATKIVDIDLLDKISRITVLVDLLNENYIPTGHPVAALKTIEIVDGSKVIHSLSGFQSQALSYYNNGKMDHNELNYENNGYCRAAVTINFGRHLWDELYALDPTKFRNLQLRIVHDKALGGCLPVAGDLRVLADLFDEKVITPVGYFAAKEVFSYTAVQAATEYITLPTDNPIRILIPMNSNDNEEPDIQFELIKIDEDDGKHVIYDGKCIDLIRMEANVRERFTEYMSGRVGTSGEEFYLSACKDIMFGINGASGTAGYFHGAWSGGSLRSLKGSATVEFGGSVSGRCPHGAVPFFFGKADDPDDWWDVGRIGKARVQLTPRATAGGGCDGNKTNDVIIQTAVPY